MSEVGFDLVPVQGHEVISELIDGYTDFVGLGIGGCEAEAAQQQKGSQQDSEDLLHRDTLLLIYSCGFSALKTVRTGAYCIISRLFICH